MGEAKTYIPYDDTYTVKPSWVWALHFEANRAIPMICCPNGHRSVMANHTFDADGTVHASILCPEQNCGWHVWGVLMDYAPYQEGEHAET